MFCLKFGTKGGLYGKFVYFFYLNIQPEKEQKAKKIYTTFVFFWLTNEAFICCFSHCVFFCNKQTKIEINFIFELFFYIKNIDRMSDINDYINNEDTQSVSSKAESTDAYNEGDTTKKQIHFVF